MPRSRIALVAACSLSLGGQATAQEAVYGATLQPRIVEGAAQTPADARFVGGYTSPGGTERYVVQFYAVRDPSDASPEGVAYASIPIARRSLETANGSELRGWADGRTCGALYGVMSEFTRLQPPLFHAPQFHATAPGASALGSVPRRVHGSVVSVWGYARQADGAPMSMMLTGTDGIIDRWVRFAEDQLSDCWTSTEPDTTP